MTSTIITRAEYVANGDELHHPYYSQFVTESTKRFVLSRLSVEKIRAAIVAGDKHLNSLRIPYNNMNHGGGWWWDNTPINIALMREAGEIGPRSSASSSAHTCVGKAAARMLAEESK